MDNQSTMIDRLGNVLYWAGCLIAPIAFMYGAGKTTMVFIKANAPIEDGFALLTGLLYSIPVYLIGLAARYILTGQGIRRKKP
jgi:hypothetical protein